MPRGGTTKGPAVTLDKSEAPAWQRLQEKNISDLERDRRAILAMAGTYRVTFDFLEVTPFGAQDGPKAPYQSVARYPVSHSRTNPTSVMNSS